MFATGKWYLTETGQGHSLSRLGALRTNCHKQGGYDCFYLSLELDSIRYLKCELNITLYFCVVVILFHLLCLWQQCSLWKAQPWAHSPSQPVGPSAAGSHHSLPPGCCFPVPLFYFSGWDRAPLSSPGWLASNCRSYCLGFSSAGTTGVAAYPLLNPIFSNTFCVCLVPSFNEQRYCNIMLCFRIAFPLLSQSCCKDSEEGSVSEGTCCLPLQPEFSPRNYAVEGNSLGGCPLTSTCVHLCTPIHATHIVNTHSWKEPTLGIAGSLHSVRWHGCCFTVMVNSLRNSGRRNCSSQ